MTDREVSVPFAALLLDLDGTLVDSMAAVERGWVAWAKKAGADVAAVLAVVHGQPSRLTIEQFAPTADVEESVKEVESMQAYESVVRAMPGARRLLSKLRHFEWAIVTSGTRRTAEHRLGQAGLPIPRYLVTSDDYQRGKPEPDPYLLAANLLSVTPDRCVAIEDTASGAMSALRAGASVVGLANPAGTYPEGVVVIEALRGIGFARSAATSHLIIQQRRPGM